MTLLAPRDPDEYLLPTERRVIRLRRHWAVVLPTMFLTFFVMLAALVLSFRFGDSGTYAWIVQNILWYVALGALLYFTYHLVEWWVERIVVTDKRVMLTTGIFTTKVAMMPVSKITDMTYERGQVQALNRIEFLPNPEEVFDAISELAFGDKPSPGGPGGGGGGPALTRIRPTPLGRVSMMSAPPRRRRR